MLALRFRSSFGDLSIVSTLESFLIPSMATPRPRLHLAPFASPTPGKHLRFARSSPLGGANRTPAKTPGRHGLFFPSKTPNAKTPGRRNRNRNSDDVKVYVKQRPRTEEWVFG